MIRTFEHSTNVPGQKTPFRAYAFTRSRDGIVSLDAGRFTRVSADSGFFYDEDKLRKDFK